MSEIPEWAVERATELARDLVSEGTSLGPGNHHFRDAFARYIAAHEEPPVDPLLEPARKIAAHARRSASGNRLCTIAAMIENGRWDSHQLVLVSLESLRRGIEIGKSDA